MAKTPKNPPQQLELRVFGDVNGSTAPAIHNQSKKVVKAAAECGQSLVNVCEASEQDRAIYRGIADRYFRS